MAEFWGLTVLRWLEYEHHLEQPVPSTVRLQEQAIKVVSVEKMEVGDD